MPAGRPSSYDPSYCAKVIEWGALGKSKTWMAASLNVARDTVNEWEHAHPEFSDAMTRAMALSQMWWEDAGQNGMVADKFNSSVWSRSMSARFPAEWRETTRQEVEQTIRDERELSDRELERIARASGDGATEAKGRAR